MPYSRIQDAPPKSAVRGATVLVLSFSAVVLLAGCGSGDSAGSGGSGDDAAEIATYSGSDRAEKLLEGAKKEGELNLYTNPTGDITDAIVDAFQEKYPDVKINVTPADSSDLARRISEEGAAGKNIVDVVETTTGALGELHDSGFLTDFDSPEESAFREDAVRDYYVGVRESYLGLGYNTDMISSDELPKTLDDLLDPKWKGKINLPTSATGVRWIATLELTKGDEFVEKMKAQDVKGQNVSGRALADLIASGEVEMSPTIYNSHVSVSQEKGAPIAWEPIEPVIAVPSALAVAANAPHPNAAMLYVDFALSKEGQEIYKSKGYDSARTDLAGDNDFETIYIDTRDDYGEQFPQWEKTTRELLGVQ